MLDLGDIVQKVLFQQLFDNRKQQPQRFSFDLKADLVKGLVDMLNIDRNIAVIPGKTIDTLTEIADFVVQRAISFCS